MENMKFRDQSLSMEERIEDLITRMTVEEKVSQLSNTSEEIPSLGIPDYNWWNEALHGVARAGTATVFPQAICMAAAFNEQLVYDIACAISEEARAKYNEAQSNGEYGIYHGLTFWSPNINIFRDPRWGRGHETYGEDPYLTGTLGVAFIKGLQQSDGKYMKAAACAKHFAVHSGPEAGRHSFDAKASKKDIFETYLPAFERCVKEGKVEAVMGAYNRLNGIPCCANSELLIDILRNRWGFEGHVVSDCSAISDICRGHEVTEDIENAAALAVKNGCDLSCGWEYESLTDAYEHDLVSEEEINIALRRTLRARFKLGMFDKPEDVSCSGISIDRIACSEYKELSLEAAKQGLVLLKNDGMLPLNKNETHKIAVIGPNAASETVLLGNYYGTPTQYSTVLSGISEYLGKEKKVLYAKGCELIGSDTESDKAKETVRKLLEEAVSAASQSDFIVAVIGLDPGLEGEEGEIYNAFIGGDKRDLELPPAQQRMLEELKKTGKHLIVVVGCGSALALTWAQDNANAIVYMWYPGEMGGKAVAELIFGEYSPSGRLPVTFYRTSEELPDFTDYSMAGRTYRYMQNEPLYPFGYGLTYTDFDYSEITADCTKLNENGSVNIKFKVENIGKFDGYEKIQVYVSPLSPSVETPRWELKAFKAVYLKKGEKTGISIDLPLNAFTLVNENGERFIERGAFRIYAGGSQPGKRSCALTNIKIEFVEVIIIHD